MTPLLLAAERNDINFVELVINVNTSTFFKTTTSNCTALHHAVKSQNVDITKCILQHCKSSAKLLKVKCKPDGGDTALDIAWRNENAEILMLLVIHQADVDRDRKNWTLKIGLIQHVSDETMEQYLEVGIDPTYRDGTGRTFLHLAAQSDGEKWIPALIKLNVVIDARAYSDKTALSIAVEKNNLSSVPDLYLLGLFS